MTNLPPSGPESFREDPLEPMTPSRAPSSRIDSLGFREFMGVFVAFTTIGAILFWSLSREKGAFDLESLLSGASSSQPASPSPLPLPLDPTPAPSTVPTEPEVGPRTVGPEIVGSEVGPRTVGPETVGPVGFSDAPTDFWAYPFIAALSQRGIISGFADNTFRPDQPVTRAEFATFVQEAFDQSPTQSAEQYKDLPSDFWATPGIQEATRTGFLTGYPGDVFRPTQQIPRVQALVALVSGLNLSSQSPTDQTLQTYQDAAQIPNWASNQVAAATEAGLVVNYPDQKSLRPNALTTRAEAAAFIHQALAQAGQAERIESDYVVRP